ncbi:MAG: Tuberculostearic acid methyltransferase UfaA1 [Candidatus Omnitrophica bacterium]|nr:Tuberculostearic acid methyltransferase UfaA1 [Candidatus Omnitrophota bacterium]
MNGSSRTADLYRTFVVDAMRPMRGGLLEVRLPSGEELRFGEDPSGPRARLHVKRDDFFRKCVLFGDVGFGEAYVDGDWETDDVAAVIRWMIHNVEHHPTLMDDRPRRPKISLLRFWNDLRHRLRANTPGQSRRNIAAHYDLGNEFFRLFLDPRMVYSSALYESPDDTLESAQLRKLERLCAKLRLSEGVELLDIGGGWGGLAFHAAQHYGCRVTVVTLSERQYEHLLRGIDDRGLHGRVEAKFIDYRRLKGAYDRIVSVEMIEAVGHEYLPAYFRQCHQLLRKDGLLVLQAILAPDPRYGSFRRTSDWIQKHIFPGGLLPSYDAIHRAVRRTGDLCLVDYEDLTASYARTLADWRTNLEAAAPQARSLGFDEKSLRKWGYYFSYCEGAFATRNITAAQIVMARPNCRLLAGEVS